MPQAFVFVVTAACLWLTAAILRRHYLRNTLSPSRFALTFAVGWSATLLVYFFMGLIIASQIRLNIGLVGLGIAIGLVNFLLSYQIAHYLYRKVLSRYFKPPNPPKT